MTTTATDKVRLGIIGLGAQGSMYAKFIKSGMVPNMEIGAICDPKPEKVTPVPLEPTPTIVTAEGFSVATPLKVTRSGSFRLLPTI